MATNLAPVDSREVVRCDHCLLVQFRTSNSLCRRCHLSLDEEEPEIVQAPAPQLVPAAHRGHLNLAASIRAMRLRNGLSQRQLAGRMSVPRTYVSKIENEKATPTLSSLERLARALEVTVPDLLSGGERNRQEEISDLIKDQFIAELLPFVSQLNGMQMSSILAQVRDLTLRPRRSAQKFPQRENWPAVLQRLTVFETLGASWTHSGPQRVAGHPRLLLTAHPR